MLLQNTRHAEVRAGAVLGATASDDAVVIEVASVEQQSPAGAGGAS